VLSRAQGKRYKESREGKEEERTLAMMRSGESETSRPSRSLSDGKRIAIGGVGEGVEEGIRALRLTKWERGVCGYDKG
jgi:hypothetical protein